MAEINGFPLETKTIPETTRVTDLGGTDLVLASSPDGSMKSITYDDFSSTFVSGTANATTTTFPASGIMVYNALESGTYTNFIDVDTGLAMVVTSGEFSTGLVQFLYDGGQWRKSVKISTITRATVLDPNDTNDVQTGKSTADWVNKTVYGISDWFVPVSGFTYTEGFYNTIKAIDYFWASDAGIHIYQVSKGQAGVNDFVGIQINTTTRSTIPRGSDVGTHTYQVYVGTKVAVLTINWDRLDAKADGYIISNNTPALIARTDKNPKYLDNTSILDFPNLPGAGATEILYDGKAIKTKANTTVTRIIGNIVGEEALRNKKISCKFLFDDSLNGIMFGFGTGLVASNRVLFGYEPAQNAVCIYIGGFFRKVVDKANFTVGNYIDMSIEYTGDKVICECNGVRYDAKDYGNQDYSLFTDMRAQLKNVTPDFYAGIDVETLTDSVFSSGSSTVLVYKTGDADGEVGYNDWCFVRLPANYDPNRKKPYPFVIGNHGNGWEMSGTEAMANFAETTQFGVDPQNDGAYLDEDAPYYKRYSSETIERLLEAGYIVCGAQNYAKAEYGSDRGRNALQDFYFHMLRNYNVEEKCFMIGASNGAMMTLNGAYLLGIERIKAMVLWYPLACLFRHYRAYAGHRSQINALYGLTGSETDEQLHQAFNDHDPEYANSVEIGGVRYKTKLFPPMKIWWSSTDTVTPSTANAEPLISLVQRSYGKVESVQIDAGGGTMQHGDWRHVDPVAILNFFDKYR